MTNPLAGKHIVLGVSGSIAVYKAADLASKLSQEGAIVNTILTDSASKFVSPLTFQSVTGQKAYTEAELWGREGHVVHIHLGHTAEALLIAPASANTIAKLANGIADNLLSVTALAATCPILVAPAMDGGMYANPATQANIQTLKERGVHFIGPAEGHLASGLVGPGRFESTEHINGYLRWMLSRGGALNGKKIVVTAGGTQEPIDPVRMITNRSSGKQGYALAQSAVDTGAEVTLITAPTHLEPPLGCKVVAVITAEQMHQAVMAEIQDAHALIMSAAVADFTPRTPEKEKIKKDSALNAISLDPTVDILRQVKAYKEKNKLELKVIGFAAESQSLKDNAVKKLYEKGLDMIAANDITQAQAGFAVDTNQVMLIFGNGSTESLPLMSKTDVADKIIQHVVAWLTGGAD
ncbi:MAG: phosphopantothenoylcysteine decarboxylase / phosphopantothenate---cysteine ligase [Chloroflexota bacterium]|nr:phosphopantothenoylcysteine decarboxylase / phosphopantothenate---cysteine ligase [Chloroflexota bacterium]